MWKLDYKESWVLKNWCFWTVVLEKTLESPLDCKEIQPVHPKGDQSWVFIGRTDVEAETPILGPPDAESWLMWLDPLIFLPPKRFILKSVLLNSILKSITSEINQTFLELWYSVQITLWRPSQKIWAREVPEPRDLRTQSMSSINVNA